MRFAVLDLELNQPSKKIIEVGVCLIEINSLKSNFLNRYQHLVNPNEDINPEIVTLTGINPDDIHKNPDLSVVFEELEGGLSIHNRVTRVSWGSDWAWLYAEMGKPAPDFLDLKQWFNVMHCWMPHKKRPRGLQGALDFYDIVSLGHPHRALYDATNTAHVLIDMLQCNEQWFKIKEMF